MNRILSRVSNHRLVQVLIVLMLVIGITASSVIAHTIIVNLTTTMEVSEEVWEIGGIIYDLNTGEHLGVFFYVHTVTTTISITMTIELQHEHDEESDSNDSE